MFESRFESGNLYLAQKITDTEYNLLMQNDTNTRGHTQWFYFRVQNTTAAQTVKFNILNYRKSDSMFSQGMRISVYSEKRADKSRIGWVKECDNIRYFNNNIKKNAIYSGQQYRTLTWTYTFEHDKDTVYFAYSVPYTYSDLRNYLEELEANPDIASFYSR